LIYVRKGEGRLTFRLMPFAIGLYEEQLPRMDRELAELFEAYLQEARGGGIYGSPSLSRVIPVAEAVPVDVEVYPYERASVLLQGAKAWAVRNCICRVQQQLIGAGCDHAVESCLVFAPVEGAFDHSQVDRAITKEEALQILEQTEEAGLVHTTGNYRDGMNYICNCCSCCCGILRGATEFGIMSAIAHSGFQAIVDAEVCSGCGDCLERCGFGALSLPDEVCVVEVQRCMGCGQCTTVCPSDALYIIRRPEGEMPPLAADRHEWTHQRAQARGMSLSEIQ
jgi:electron transport complex protein RnfB